MLKIVEYGIYTAIICVVFMLMSDYKYQPTLAEEEYTAIDEIEQHIESQQKFVSNEDNDDVLNQLDLNAVEIKVGENSELIKVIQELLNIEADGYFGNSTLIAIQEFQSKHQLNRDDIIRKDTLEILLREKLPLSKKDLSGYSNITKHLQNELDLPSDGYFGDETYIALKSLQKESNLNDQELIDNKIFTMIIKSLI